MKRCFFFTLTFVLCAPMLISFGYGGTIGISGSISGAINTTSTTLQVGPGRPYAKPSEAAAVAQDVDIIEIDDGNYVGDVAIWRANNLTIRGKGGYAHMQANGQNAEGKGIWVIKGDNTTIENIEFSGATVPDENGAGIRLEGSGLTVRGCYFHDNEDGILGSGGSTSDIVVEFSEFSNNGFGDGFSHNIYILKGARSFTLRFCYVHHAKIGHNVKTRALTNYILYNRIMDEQTGTSSYAVDIPNGGTSYLIGNLIQQGPKTENSTIIFYGAEGLSNPKSDFYVVNNTIVNDRHTGKFVRVGSDTESAKLINNIFAGAGEVLTGPGELINNLVSDDPGLVNAPEYDYHLNATSPAIDAGSDPGSANGFSLMPVSHYIHPLGSESRAIAGPIDIGAYEFGGNPVSVELSSLTAELKNDSVLLYWSTASESNNFGFYIERKTATSIFEVIGFVKGKGTTTQSQVYSFVDKFIKPSMKYAYRLKQIDLDGTFKYSGVAHIEVPAPTEFRLLGNYPNPFNPTTTIHFVVPVKSKITLKVYDITGKIVQTLLANEVKEAGRYSTPFNASELSSGVYFYQLIAEENWIQTSKMILVK